MRVRNSRRGALAGATLLVLGVVVTTSAPTASAKPMPPGPSWSGRHRPRCAARTMSRHPKLQPSLAADSNGQTPLVAAAHPDASGRTRVEVDGADTAAVQSAIVDAGGDVYSIAPGSILADVPQPDLGRLSDDPRVAERARAPSADRRRVGRRATDRRVCMAGRRSHRRRGQGRHRGSGLHRSRGATRRWCRAGQCDDQELLRRRQRGLARRRTRRTASAWPRSCTRWRRPRRCILVCFDQDADLLPIVSYLSSQGVTIVNASWGTPFGRGDGSGGPGTDDLRSGGRTSGRPVVGGVVGQRG